MATFTTKDFERRETEKGLRAIYGSAKDRSDLNELRHEGRSFRRLLWFIGACVVLVAAGFAWLGFVVFNPSSSFDGDDVVVDIRVSERVQSGGATTIELSYANTSGHAISDVSVLLEYPTGFTFLDSTLEPFNDLSTRWNIGRLASGESGSFSLSGYYRGDIGTEIPFLAEMSYVPDNFSSEFIARSRTSSLVDSSVLAVYAQGSNQVINGELVTYEIVYDDFSEVPLVDDVALELLYPEGFVFESSSLSLEEGKRLWSSEKLLSVIDASGSGRFTVTGRMQSDDAGSRTLVARLGFMRGGVLVPEVEARTDSEVVTSDFILTLSSDVDNEDLETIPLGSSVTYTLSYENRGEVIVSDAVLRVYVDSPLVDWSLLSSEPFGVHVDNYIEWNSSDIEELSAIDPGGTGSISFSLPLRGSEYVRTLRNAGGHDENDFLSLTAYGEGEFFKTRFVGGPVSSTSALDVKTGILVLNIAPEVMLYSSSRYYDDVGGVVGSGAFPPRVGEVTRYNIDWNLESLPHPLRDVVIVAQIPEGVSLVETNGLSYDDALRQIRWEQSYMPAGDDISLSFEVGYTPRAQDVGTSPVILSTTSLMARDDMTGDLVEATAPRVTTNPDASRYGSGKGIVIE